MKKKMLLLCSLVMLPLMGCEPLSTESIDAIQNELLLTSENNAGESETVENTDTTSVYQEVSNYDIGIWTDPETGVQYIIYCDKFGNAGMGGITPRLNADGNLYVVEKNTVD